MAVKLNRLTFIVGLHLVRSTLRQKKISLRRDFQAEYVTVRMKLFVWIELLNFPGEGAAV